MNCTAVIYKHVFCVPEILKCVSAGTFVDGLTMETFWATYFPFSDHPVV